MVCILSFSFIEAVKYPAIVVHEMLHFTVQLLAATAVLPFGTAERNGKRDFDVFDYIDPLIGTSNGGELAVGTKKL